MILTVSKKEFADKIASGIKVHAIVLDEKNRWKIGNNIDFWLGSPRSTKCESKSFKIGIGEVSRIESIRMDFAIPEDWQQDIVYIGNDIILKYDDELNALAENEGFDDWKDMRCLFDNPEKQYFGKIIFWKIKHKGLKK